MLSKTIWFQKRIKYDIDFFELLKPQRIINQHSRYNTGIYYSRKCDREIQYESGLELAFYQQLEQIQEVKFYWEQPIRIPFLRGRRKDCYTPDVAIYLNTNEIILVEIKSLPSILDFRVQTRIDVLLDFCYKKGFGLLITDGKNTIDKIFKTKSNRKFENALLKAIEKRIIRKRECKELMLKYNATHNQLLKAILKYNLKFNPFPFKIQNDNRNKIFHQIFFKKKKYEEIESERFATIFNRIREYNSRGKP